jgi:putative endonuclease
VSAGRHHAGLAAEEIAARAYTARGGTVIARRHRTAEGEIDLIVEVAGMVVFVEVKQRRRATGADSPISASQWRRIGAAATGWLGGHQARTGTIPPCRFDAALIGPDGALTLIEHAWWPEED